MPALAIPIVVLLAWAVAIVFIYRRWLDYTWVVLLLTIALAILLGVGPFSPDMVKLISTGPLSIITILPPVFLASVFARAITETGIAQSIVKTAIELGGERRTLTVFLVLIASIYVLLGVPSTGGVVVLATIALPIMLALGLTPVVAAGILLGAQMVAWPYYFAVWPLLKTLTGAYPGDYPQILLMTSVIGAIGVFAFTLYAMRRSQPEAAWAAPAVAEGPADVARRTPVYTFVAPLIPLVLIIGLGWNIIVAMFLATLLTLLIALPSNYRGLRALSDQMTKVVYGGGVDSVPLLVNLAFVGLFTTLATLDGPKQLLAAGAAEVVPTTVIAFILFAGLLAVTSVVRGPGNYVGLGAITFTAMQASGLVSPVAALGILQAWNYPWTWADPTHASVVWLSGYLRISPVDIFRKCVLWTLPMPIVLAIILGLTYVK